VSKRAGNEKIFTLLDILEKDGTGQPLCPSCQQASIIRPEGEVMYYCTNAACPAQARQRIEHFASRGAMDIRGIGENLSAALYDAGLVKNIADIYTLKDKKNNLLRLEKLVKKAWRISSPPLKTPGNGAGPSHLRAGHQAYR
jgi:DNA ligase (NAD+)